MSPLLPAITGISVSNHEMVPVLLILMLKELTELAKGFDTRRATVRQVGDVVRIVTIREHRNFVEKRSQNFLLASIAVNLTPCIIFPGTAFAVSALDMLHSVGSRLEANFAAYGTGNLSWTMDLHVHIQRVLIREHIVTYMTLVVGTRNTVFAARVTIALRPLVATEAAVPTPPTTLATLTLHGQEE